MTKTILHIFGDTVCKASLQLAHHVINFIKGVFDGQCHCTKFAGNTSAQAGIQASVIQEYSIGPASYVVTAADLEVLHDSDRLVKFADDTYLIVPPKNSDHVLQRLHISRTGPVPRRIICL